ncbi:YfcE family phosphodiesterase [Stratiformator vulcanicus]|uniref:Phosphoesterase n=1 Tax=Stratiformator vulcanicus TaxID=2527980 RepID=A0A517R0V2_9PLAN|nr:YfcE family phosphodiesterase [Stratiformator vulcanicus]QDT37460.1 phosphodiesterase [Stratiformator vulcanicus]
MARQPEFAPKEQMKIAVFADTHDHVSMTQRAINFFNAAEVDLTIFAGDLVSPILTPTLRRLSSPLVACFGDNEGNRIGITGGLRTVGTIAQGPIGVRTEGDLRILITHQLELCRGFLDDARIVIWAHTHRPGISRDSSGRLFVNPGETCGWVFGRPTVALIETNPNDPSATVARIIDLEPEPSL